MYVCWKYGSDEIVEGHCGLKSAIYTLVRDTGAEVQIALHHLPPVCDDSGHEYNVWIDLAYDWQEDYELAPDADDIQSDVVSQALDLLNHPRHFDDYFDLLAGGRQFRCGKGRSLGKVWCTVTGTVEHELRKT